RPKKCQPILEPDGWGMQGRGLSPPAQRRFRGNVCAVLQHGNSGRIGVLQDLGVHMHHHLQPLKSKAWRVV
ncbi:MAG: hypothetical protein WBO53_03010, partial [Thermoanaerobaculia bacterium]